MLYYNLEGHRCPTAMIRVRRAVAQFAGGGQPHLVIDAIEPSLGRDLMALLAHSHPGLELAETQTLPLTGEVMARWHEDFDSEELAGITVLTRYLVSHRQGD